MEAVVPMGMRRNSQRGMSLIETMIAMLVLTVGAISENGTATLTGLDDHGRPARAQAREGPIFSMMAEANSDVFSTVAPSICRSKS